MASMSAITPKRLTGQMARVRGVMAASIRPASIRYVSGSMSTKTGEAPVKRVELTVAWKVCETVITSSPGPSPRPAKMDMRATVPFETAIACLAPQNAAQRSSSSATFRPWAIMPLFRTSVTAATSSGPRSGRAGGIMLDSCALRRSLCQRAVLGIEIVAPSALRAGEGSIRGGIRSGVGAGRIGQSRSAGADPTEPSGWVAGHQGEVGDVASHYGAGSHRSESAYRRAGHDNGTRADRATVTERDRAHGP